MADERRQTNKAGRGFFFIIGFFLAALFALSQYNASDLSDDADLIAAATRLAMERSGLPTPIPTNAPIPLPTLELQNAVVQPTLTELPATPTPLPATFTVSPTFLPPTASATPTATFTPAPPTPTLQLTVPLPTLAPLATNTATALPATATLLPTLPPTSEGTPITPTALAPTATEPVTTTPLPVDPPATNNTSERIHTVAVGENLYRIAEQYSLTMDEIAASNGIVDYTQLFVGQELIIPNAGMVADATTSTDRISITQPTPPPPRTVNGIPIEQFLQMPPNVVSNMREIYARGQELGRNPRAFTRIGDSTIEPPHFLTRFDGDFYNLGEYAYLQDVINYYAGSFDHDSVAVRRGLHTWSVFDPMWTTSICNGGEHMLSCEIRRQNPSLIFVRLGSNDRGVPDATERNLRQIVDFMLANGVIPILGTKADRFDGAQNINNQIIRQIASDYELPLWDFDLLAGTIPGRGLGPDNVHMTIFFAHDWTQQQAFTTGHGVHNLSALIVLDRVWQALQAEPGT